MNISEGPIRLMIVDDSSLDRERMRMALRGVDVEIIREVTNGRDAVEHYYKERPDVVLMDLVMPRMSGPEAAVAILKLDPQARIIPMSGLAHPSVMAETARVGMQGFLLKPVEREDLVVQLAEAVHR